VKHLFLIAQMPVSATTSDIPQAVLNKVTAETAALGFIVAILDGLVPVLDSKTATA
jgi:hypothetical protein